MPKISGTHVTVRSFVFKILFVCTGNICRSPTAEGVFRNLLKTRCLTDLIKVDSAGLGSWHVGDPPDPRSTETAIKRGIDIRHQKARAIRPHDFEEFDLLLAMDKTHYSAMKRSCPPELQSRIHMFMNYARNTEISEVPDPYYGSSNGFDRVFDLIEAASEGLLEEIETNYIIR